MTYLCKQLKPFEEFCWGTSKGPFLLNLVKFSLADQEMMLFDVFHIKFNVKL